MSPMAERLGSQPYIELGAGQQTNGIWTHTGKLIISGVRADGTPVTITLPDDWVPAGSQNSTYSGEWNWSTNTNVPPSNGQLRSNTGNVASAIELRFSVRTAANIDAKAALMAITGGNKIRIQQKTDSTRWARYQPTGAKVDNGTYISVPVSFIEGSGKEPGGNTALIVSILVS